MSPAPNNFPCISPAIYYEDAHAAIDWLCKAFDFKLRLKVEDDQGGVMHSELTYNDGVIMVSGKRGHDKDARFLAHCRSPRELSGANTQNLMVYVDDIDAHFKRAEGAGAKIVDPISVHDYGEEYWADRSYGVMDCDGHQWWFTQRMRNASK